MPEILTESFCERCGTRYTFESTAPRKTRKLGQFKTLGKGVKNWVMSDDSSLDEALAEARSDEERALTTQQLDAFHSTFNFCMTCRQYTCGNCWNTSEGRCLSCAPHLGHEILPAPFPDVQPFEPVRIEAEAWPEADLSTPADAAAASLGIEGLPTNGVYAGSNGSSPDGNGHVQDEMPEFDAAARLAFLSGETLSPPAAAPVEPEPVETLVAEVAAEPVPDEAGERNAAAEAFAAAEILARIDAVVPPSAESVVMPEALIGAEALPEPTEMADGDAPDTIAPVVGSDSEVEEIAAAGAAHTADLLARFRPGQNIDAELEAYEAQLAAADLGVTVEDAAVTAAAAAISPVEPEPASPLVDVAALAVAGAIVREPEPEPVVAAEPVREPEPAPVAEPVALEPELPPVAAEPVVAAPVIVPEPVVAPEPDRHPIAAVAAALAADAVIDGPADAEPAAAPAAVEPVAAAASPAPEPEAAPVPSAPEDQPQPVAAEPAPTSAPVREDRIEQPTWQIFAPDQAVEAPPATQPPASPSPVPVQASGDPQWPVRADAEESPSMALLTNRSRVSSEAMWAASAQEVLATPAKGMTVPVAGVQPCSSCGLSLSANARFCRRCGTRQAV